MNQPQQPPPVSTQSVIRNQKQEIERANDNRVYLMALLDDLRAETTVEVAKRDSEIERLTGVVVRLKGMLAEDVIEEAEAIINGQKTVEG